MSDPKPHYRVSYTRTLPPDDEMPNGCSVYCDDNDERADKCIIDVDGQEFTFGRSTFDPTRWDSARDRLESALQKTFEQGRAVQRQIMRDALGLPNNWGGPMHGRSGT
jgi:hypothetical protein